MMSSPGSGHQQEIARDYCRRYDDPPGFEVRQIDDYIGSTVKRKRIVIGKCMPGSLKENIEVMKKETTTRPYSEAGTNISFKYFEQNI